MRGSLRKKLASKAKEIIRVGQGVVDTPADVPPPTVEDTGPTGIPTETPEKGVDEEKIEEEVTEEIEEKKKHEEEVESLGSKLDKLIDTIGSLVDAMSEQKSVIEKNLLGEPPTEEKLEDLKEDTKDEQEEEFSQDEFGLSENLVFSKEEKMGELRKARKSRLAAYKGKKAETLSEQLGEERGQKITPKIPPVTITKVKEEAPPAMFKIAEVVLDLSEDKSKWILSKASDKGEEPLFEICVSDSTKEKFATEEFASNLILEMRDNGIEKTLEKYGAKKIEKVEKVAEKTETKVEVKAEEKKESAFDYKLRHGRALKLALSAMQKNLLPNPLKASFYEVLVAGLKLDEDDAVNAIEAAFEKGSEDHMNTALVEADKYLGMSDEAFVEYESQIGELNTNTVQVEKSEKFSEEASALRKRASESSVPLVASTPEQVSMTEKITNMLRPKLNVDVLKAFKVGNKNKV